MRRLATGLFCALFASFVIGCNSEKLPGLGRVTGTVTMNGKPVPDATIIFEPKSGALSAAMGRTDASGNYELYYSRGNKGTAIGENVVRISTLGETGDDANRQPKPETIPKKYNVESELTADVKRGNNKFDFELKPSGDIYQPAEVETATRKARSATGCW